MKPWSADTTIIENPQASARRFACGLAGFLFAVVAIGLLAALPRVREAREPQQNLPDLLAESGDKFVGRLIDRVRGKQPAPPPAPVIDPVVWWLSMGVTFCGLVGVVIGTFAWVRRENLRLAGSAIVMGSVVVAAQYIFIALVMAFVVVIFIVAYGWWLNG